MDKINLRDTLVSELSDTIKSNFLLRGIIKRTDLLTFTLNYESKKCTFLLEGCGVTLFNKSYDISKKIDNIDFEKTETEVHTFDKNELKTLLNG